VVGLARADGALELRAVGGLRVGSRARVGEVRELVLERHVVGVHAVSERDLVALQDAGDHLEIDVDDVTLHASLVTDFGPPW